MDVGYFKRIWWESKKGAQESIGAPGLPSRLSVRRCNIMWAIETAYNQGREGQEVPSALDTAGTLALACYGVAAVLTGVTGSF